jgi:hypothetical protein
MSAAGAGGQGVVCLASAWWWRMGVAGTVRRHLGAWPLLILQAEAQGPKPDAVG